MDNVKTFKTLVIISIAIELVYFISVFFEGFSAGALTGDMTDSSYLLGESAKDQSEFDLFENLGLKELILVLSSMALIPLYILALFLLYKFSRLGRRLYITLSVGSIPLIFLMPASEIVSSYIDLLYYMITYTMFGAIVAVSYIASDVSKKFKKGANI